MSAFTTDKANQEFELKFTAPAGLLLNVSEPIANKNAVYHQLGVNLATARRAIEQLQGEEVHTVEHGGTLAECMERCALHYGRPLDAAKAAGGGPGRHCSQPVQQGPAQGLGHEREEVLRERVRGVLQGCRRGPRRSREDGRSSWSSSAAHEGEPGYPSAPNGSRRT